MSRKLGALNQAGFIRLTGIIESIEFIILTFKSDKDEALELIKNRLEKEKEFQTTKSADNHYTLKRKRWF